MMGLARIMIQLKVDVFVTLSRTTYQSILEYELQQQEEGRVESSHDASRKVRCCTRALPIQGKR